MKKKVLMKHLFLIFFAFFALTFTGKTQEITLSNVPSSVHTEGSISFNLEASGYPENTIYKVYLLNESDSAEVFSDTWIDGYTGGSLPEGMNIGNYELYAYGVTEDGDTIKPVNYTVPMVEVYNGTITITGTSAGDDVICLSENPTFEIYFETEGVFPDDVVFTATALYSYPYEIGSATGNDASSITVTDFPPYNTATYDFLINTSGGYTSEIYRIDVVQEVDPAKDYLIYPSEDVTQPEGSPLEVAAYNDQGIGLNFKLVHLETGTAVTDWFVIPDDPGDVVVENPMEGTYQLVGSGVGGGAICQDSVPLNMAQNSFTLEYGTVTSISEKSTTEMSVYPNPARQSVNVKLPSNSSGAVQMQVTNLSGTVLKSNSANNQGELNFNVQDLPSGMYLLKMITDDGVKVKSFMKQ